MFLKIITGNLRLKNDFTNLSRVSKQFCGRRRLPLGSVKFISRFWRIYSKPHSRWSFVVHRATRVPSFICRWGVGLRVHTGRNFRVCRVKLSGRFLRIGEFVFTRRIASGYVLHVIKKKKKKR